MYEYAVKPNDVYQGWANFLARGPDSKDDFDRGPH